MRVAWVRARCFVHATEDEDRVRDTLLWVLGIQDAAKARDRVERKRAKGHYGNPILVLEATLKRRRDVDAALMHLLDDAGRRAELRRTLKDRLDDDHVIHVRLDKQAAVTRRLALQTGSDAIVVRVKGILDPDETPAKGWAARLEPPAP